MEWLRSLSRFLWLDSHSGICYQIPICTIRQKLSKQLPLHCTIDQGISRDLFNGFWYVTVLNIGPIHDNSLSCAQNLEFRPELFKLKHLKALSFNCFQSQNRLLVTSPNGNWEKLAGILRLDQTGWHHRSFHHRATSLVVKLLPTYVPSLCAEDQKSIQFASELNKPNKQALLRGHIRI